MNNNTFPVTLAQMYVVRQRWVVRHSVNSWCLVNPLYSGLLSVIESICVSWYTDNRCVSSRQRPPCSAMQRAGNRLVEGKVKDNSPSSPSSSCFLHLSPQIPSPPSAPFSSPPLHQQSPLLGLGNTEYFGQIPQY